MSETLVSLARRSDGLVAVLSLLTEDESGIRCSLVQRPIAKAMPVVSPRVRTVVGAWDQLERARLDDPEAVAAAVVVMLETVPLDGGTRAGRLTPPPPPMVARRTAAHSRGWVGFRPARARPTDLRLVLCQAGSWAQLRIALRAAKTHAFPILRDAGYEAAALNSLLSAQDPYLAYHHGACFEAGARRLPPAFRASILPLLRQRPWPEIREAIALHWALDLERDNNLLPLVVRLLAVAPAHGLKWAALLPTQPPERRATFLQLLFASGAQTQAPGDLSPTDAAGFAPLDEGRYTDRWKYLFDGLVRGLSVRHGLEAFAVADAVASDYRFAKPWRYPKQDDSRSTNPHRLRVLSARLRPILEHAAAGAQESWELCSLVELWDISLRRPDVVRVVTRPTLLSWSSEALLRFLRLLLNAAEKEDGDVPLDTLGHAAETLLGAIPAARQRMALDSLDSFLYCTREPAEHLATGCALLTRLARGSFAKEVNWGYAVAHLVEAVEPKATAQLLDLPERSLIRIERALLREDGERLLHAGLASLARWMGRFIVTALAANPEAALETARLLGGLRLPRRQRVLKLFRRHPVLRRGFERRPIEEVCQAIQAVAGPGVPNPIPRKLRDHLLGVTTLSTGSMERHRQTIFRGLLPFKLGLLRHLILQDLARGLPAPNVACSKERHALQMLGSARLNRRMLRRILGRGQAERTAFLQGHPGNQQWFRKHPKAHHPAWLGGRGQDFALPGIGAIRLAIETDPLEVLQLGTLVGSCLSVAGLHDDSAVTVMLDANKNVIFARRSDGAFIARQLVAVTEDDRLACFPVYPHTVADSIKEAFHAFDLGLAAALGLEVAASDEYKVALILGRYFYDDGLWERFCPPVQEQGQ